MSWFCSAPRLCMREAIPLWWRESLPGRNLTVARFKAWNKMLVPFTSRLSLHSGGRSWASQAAFGTRVGSHRPFGSLPHPTRPFGSLPHPGGELIRGKITRVKRGDQARKGGAKEDKWCERAAKFPPVVTHGLLGLEQRRCGTAAGLGCVGASGDLR